ncbi:hypothetical protein ASC77_03995 [Nocardioides sp. Root1257]|uniref:hypothetical protein n=1 Tax=unclassified Nocardioides TaxID=2615069 RepID=UPI0006FC403F|nr:MULTISPECIES: hypothetical protein [unclassified Nocardioides]KQW53453.1 hypothetical protein ASC77_03995 [Nocardioides sp. Root1257]KRC56139.1 hypothetical protein ASE24_03995 [Nocardioides sp. Root224]
MTSTSVEKDTATPEPAAADVAPAMEPAVGPAAPMPMPVLGRDEPVAANAERQPQLSGQMNMNPKTLDELLKCNNVNIRFLAQQTSPKGPLRDILVGAFEADWFRAKSCLVFDKWPGDVVPRFTHEFSLMLMTALTSYRGEVHKAVMPLAQKAVRKQLDERARQLEGNAALASSLTQQRMIPGVKQIDFKGSVGADTVTSDVDVSTGGANSELGVRAYNEAFREFMDLTFDPGTVFDLNVYAMDFIHGKTDAADQKSFTVKSENPEKPEAEDAAARDREQDIWALVHVARYMPDDGDWDDYVVQTISGISDAKQQAEQKARLDAARKRAKGFEERLVGMMVHLEEDLMLTEKQLEGSSWDDEDNKAYLQGALRMRAANKLYEDKLLQVKELRTQIAEMRTSITQGKQGADPERLKLLVSRLSGELSMAQLYANEVYGTGGATVHAVMGMQVKKKLSAERGHDVEAIIPVQEWYQAFTDNLGDVLKDFEHYGKGHGGHEADHWYAAFKMGKYADRMVDALPHLAEGGMITQTDAATLAKDADVEALRTLSTHHVKEKSGASKDDPAKLKQHTYFGKMTADSLKDLRTAALNVGARVRQMVAGAQSAPIVDPSAAPPAPVPEKAPTTAASGASLRLAAQAARAQDLLEEIEDEAEDMEP